ncbi:tetratricopeptide repeat protein [uncultured Paraglaciecola sp.]|uniref:tetratricopeptide repeat protein n=1 Tax=uncultured Paraglaciecola sp. TaxID=1765024 RepID=UPI002603F796|nr:tetratricopeptide repeat protein [uncultured Paraglaciecola sp.]
MWKWLCGLGCCVAFICHAQQVRQTHSVELEKTYQQVLYEYYQGNFSLALTYLAILQQKYPDGLDHIPEYLSGYQVEPELLKGGISLAYGLDDQAAEIFLRLLKSNPAADVTAYSWLLLGKTYYKKRLYPEAAQAFQKISQQDANQYFDISTRDNWLYMQSQLYGFLLSEDQGGKNIQWLQQLSDASIYRDYVQYNQALALLHKGDSQLAIAGLSNLANNQSSTSQSWLGWAAPIFTENSETNITAERDAIRDRANLTLGYTLLQNNQPHKAFRAFKNIRSDGLDAQAALLGYGWAASKRGELQTALAIWQRLIHTPHNSEYTLEAYLASAYAYEKAFAPTQSMQLLKLGLERFKQALTGLNQAEQQVKQPQFILDLLPNTKGQPHDDYDVSLSLKDKGQQFNAAELFNTVSVSSEFRAVLSALSENRDMHVQLQNWQQQMQHYHLMLDERKIERSKRAEHILQDQNLAQLPALQAQRNTLAAILASAEEQQDGQVLMSQQSQQWLSRVARSKIRLARIKALKKQHNQAPLKNSYAERIERVAGRLIWQASEAFPANKWQAKKALQQLDNDIIQTQQRQQQLLKQLAATPDFAAQRHRVSALAQRIDDEIVSSELIQEALIAQLSDTFNQFIQAHKQKVRHYILQAQLAVVRLNDQALQKHSDKLIPEPRVPENKDVQL